MEISGERVFQVKQPSKIYEVGKCLASSQYRKETNVAEERQTGGK